MSQSQEKEYQSYNEHHHDALKWIKDHKSELPTPLYLYSESDLNMAVTTYRSLFPQKTRGFYSLKANPQPELVRHFSSLGIGAEIVGHGEWQMCALADVLSANILAGGVSKSEAFLQTLCSHNAAAIVIESETEWRRLKKVVVDSHPTQILLRINPGVSFGGLNMAGGSQFGLSVEQAITIARDCLINTHVDFLGLHFYFGSQRLEVSPIIQAVEVVEKTIQTFQQSHIDLNVVDLGLGCGIPYLAKDIALDIASLREQLDSRWQNPIWSNIAIWFETGRALVAGAGYFVARVMERKRLHGETFIFLDGGLNVHNPGIGLGRFFRRNPQFCFLTDKPEDGLEPVNIVGNLCATADTLGTDVLAPRLEEGDMIVIPNSGAYCQTTAFWGFNSQPLFFEGMLTQDDSLNMFRPQHELLRN